MIVVLFEIRQPQTGLASILEIPLAERPGGQGLMRHAVACIVSELRLVIQIETSGSLCRGSISVEIVFIAGSQPGTRRIVIMLLVRQIGVIERITVVEYAGGTGPRSGGVAARHQPGYRRRAGVPVAIGIVDALVGGRGSRHDVGVGGS